MLTACLLQTTPPTGIGLNYLKHAEEASLPLPTAPILFMKLATSLTGTFPAKVVIPKHTLASDSADYESELGVIMARDCKDVSEAEALDYVLGYTATNDISSRTAQFETSQWCYSKGFDTACPAGRAEQRFARESSSRGGVD